MGSRKELIGSFEYVLKGNGLDFSVLRGAMAKRIFSILIIVSAMILYSNIAYAERCAIFFVEFQHQDVDQESEYEILTVTMSINLLQSSYARFYWLINTDATRDNLLETMQTAFNDYTTVDLYIIAHGGMQFFRGHFDDRIYVEDILSIKSLDNAERLRLVYIGSCHGWDTTDEFLEAGAISTIGSTTKINNYPFYPLFILNFGIRNQPVGTATKLSSIIPDEIIEVNGDQTIRIDSQD